MATKKKRSKAKKASAKQITIGKGGIVLRCKVSQARKGKKGKK